MKQKLFFAATLAIMTGATSTFGQSADALIDKLVDKGILNVKEANELREQADQNFTTAFSSKNGMPEWVSSLRFNGDMRLRYEGFHVDDPAFVDRHRFRYRLRFGTVAALNDNFEVGFRLTSGENGRGVTTLDPISGNSTFQDNASKKLIGVDLAYVQWKPLDRVDWGLSFTGGKMENPFAVSDMMFDSDYTPEGLSERVRYTFNDQHGLELNLGQFILDEVSGSSSDPYLFGGQVRLNSTWNPHWQSTIGLAAFTIQGEDSLTTGAVPDQNGGNTRTAGGALVHEYNPIYVDGAITYKLESFPTYSGAFPIRFLGDYIYNPGASSRNMGFSAGIIFGKSGKRRTWDVGYRYKYLGGDAWFEEFVDSDSGAFYGSAPTGGSRGYVAGTNIRGHSIRATYSPLDSMTMGLTYYLFELINAPSTADSQTGRWQLDAAWKF